jgi:50S ribosomal protein L16 3-hydroxylase
LDALSPGLFLREHWQKRPLFIRRALPAGLPSIDADELAWLATLEDVESRIVFTERIRDRCRYEVEHGPFDEERLRALPERDWTLLVNDVDKHLPEFRAIIDWIDFIPDWRVDDLMISFAAPGGGVGPHCDNYDVFLCQVDGTRRWLYTTGITEPDPGASDDIALVRPFGADPVDAQRGDMLYLPPGIAHWGTAVDACLTLSIGMRAPRLSDLLDEPTSQGEDPFYDDPDLQLSEAKPGLISEQAIDRAVNLAGAATTMSRDEIADRLGRFVTSPKDWLRPEAADVPADPGRDLLVHGMTQIAFDSKRAYVNGDSRILEPGELPIVEALSQHRRLDRANLPDMLHDHSGSELICWLMRCGAFDSGSETG